MRLSQSKQLEDKIYFLNSLQCTKYACLDGNCHTIDLSPKYFPPCQYAQCPFVHVQLLPSHKWQIYVQWNNMFSFREPITYGLFLALLGFFNDFSSAHEKATVLQCVVLLKLKMPWMLRRGKRFHLSSKVKNHVSAWICRHTLVSENHHQMTLKKCIFLPWKSCWIIAIWIMALFTTKLLTNRQNWKSFGNFFWNFNILRHPPQQSVSLQICHNVNNTHSKKAQKWLKLKSKKLITIQRS